MGHQGFESGLKGITESLRMIWGISEAFSGVPGSSRRLSKAFHGHFGEFQVFRGVPWDIRRVSWDFVRLREFRRFHGRFRESQKTSGNFGRVFGSFQGASGEFRGSQRDLEAHQRVSGASR